MTTKSLFGFHVTVIDWRPALCHHGHFPEAGHLITGAPEEVMTFHDFFRCSCYQMAGFRKMAVMT
jgi:hypothetical protein